MAKKKKAVKKTVKKKVAKKKLTKKTVKKKASKKAVKKTAKKKVVVKKISVKPAAAQSIPAVVAGTFTMSSPSAAPAKPAATKKKYKCLTCGKVVETSGTELQPPMDCGRPMTQVAVDNCAKPTSAETSRLFDDDDACDDGRDGSKI